MDLLVEIWEGVVTNMSQFLKKLNWHTSRQLSRCRECKLEKYHVNTCQIIVVGGGQCTDDGLFFSREISRQLSGGRVFTIE